MIGFDPAPLPGALHVYLGKTWEWTGAGWKRSFPVATGGWPLFPIEVGISLDSAPEQLSLPWRNGLVERLYNIEISANPLASPIPQPLLVTYI